MCPSARTQPHTGLRPQKRPDGARKIGKTSSTAIPTPGQGHKTEMADGISALQADLAFDQTRSETHRLRLARLGGMIAGMVITIDGAAGSGKSTVARKLAARLEIAYLDTGAMYRAIAYAAIQRGVDLSSEPALVALTREAELEVDCGPTHTRVRVGGHDVTEAIRSMEVSRVTSLVAKCQAVREQMVTEQRRTGAALGSFVSEGRDQGSVVFPDADAKFVLDATLERRAERRYREMEVDGEEVTLEEVRENLERRDAVDTRQWEPLLEEGAAVVIDTTDLSIQQVVDKMAAIVNRSMPA